MLGVGKAAPAQFVLRGKTNLRRISAAGQKAGFVAYPSHWPSIWWDVIGGQCVFFANTRRIVASFVSLATSFLFAKNSSCAHAAAPRFQIEPAYAGLRFGENGRLEKRIVSVNIHRNNKIRTCSDGRQVRIFAFLAKWDLSLLSGLGYGVCFPKNTKGLK